VQQRQLSMRSSTSCRDTLEVSGPPDRRFYVRIMPDMGGLVHVPEVTDFTVN